MRYFIGDVRDKEIEGLLKITPVVICLSNETALIKVIVFFVGYPVMTQWAAG